MRFVERGVFKDSIIKLHQYVIDHPDGDISWAEPHEKAGLAFIEVFVDAPLAVVEQRDPKGL